MTRTPLPVVATKTWSEKTSRSVGTSSRSVEQKSLSVQEDWLTVMWCRLQSVAAQTVP